jgi:Leucine-rich repeat (LRR) protein
LVIGSFPAGKSDELESGAAAANKIPLIENLGVTQVSPLFLGLDLLAVACLDCLTSLSKKFVWFPQNQFDIIDFTDNTIVLLEGFPKLPRLKRLYLNNNRIMRIGKHLEGEHVGTILLSLLVLCRLCALPRQSSPFSVHGPMFAPALNNCFLVGDCGHDADSIPNLLTLILTNNKLKKLQVILEFCEVV